MPQEIQLKRSNQLHKIPKVDQLLPGEVAINTAEGKLYLKKDNNGVDPEEIILINSVVGQVWDVAEVYKIGDIVTYAGTPGNIDSNLYISTVAGNQGSHPPLLSGWYNFNNPRYNVGTFTPSVFQEYPVVVGLEQGSVWYIVGLDDGSPPPGPQGGYIMTTGPLAGILVSNNDRFVWYGLDVDNNDIWLHEMEPDWVEERGGIAFNSVVFYVPGDIVTYDGIVWMAPNYITAGPWTQTQWTRVYSEKGGIYWDDSIQYESGDLVTFNDVVYMAPTPRPAVGQAPGTPSWPLVPLERGGVKWELGQNYKFGDTVWDDRIGPAALYGCTVSHTSTASSGGNGSPQNGGLNWTETINEDPGTF